jgi:hypothetical protein
VVDAGLVGGDHVAALVQAVRLEPHSFRVSQNAEAVQMRGRAGREEEGGTEVVFVGQMYLQPVCRDEFGFLGTFRSFRNDRKIADKFATAAEVAGDGDAL